jgi:hypothetical protein
MIAAQQSLWESAALFDRHANAGAAVQKRTATNINNALLLRIFISATSLPLQESSNSVPRDSDLHHVLSRLEATGSPKVNPADVLSC